MELKLVSVKHIETCKNNISNYIYTLYLFNIDLLSIKI